MSSSGEWPGQAGQAQVPGGVAPGAPPQQPSWMNGAIGAGVAAVVVLAVAIVFVLVSGDDDSGGGDGEAAATTTSDQVLEPEDEDGYGDEDREAGEMVHVSDLDAGMCLHAPEEEAAVTELEVVDCDVRHDYEVFHVGDLEDGPWRGAEQVGEDADALCEGPFEDYVGLPLEDSELEVNHLSPTSSSWQDANDRQVSCLLGEPGGRTTGSLADADR